MTDQYPNIKEEFNFDGAGKRRTKFWSRFTDAKGRLAKVGLQEDGEISDERRKEIYRLIDEHVKQAQHVEPVSS